MDYIIGTFKMSPAKHVYHGPCIRLSPRQTDAQLPQGEAIDVQVKFLGNPGDVRKKSNCLVVTGT